MVGVENNGDPDQIKIGSKLKNENLWETVIGKHGAREQITE